MICPVCVSQSLLSRVRVSHAETLASQIDAFWDETGIYHEHDSSPTITVYECSKGHKFKDVVKRPCPAGDSY